MTDSVTQLTELFAKLCSALLRKDTEQDGNWGNPRFLDEVGEIEAALTSIQNTQSTPSFYLGDEVAWAMPMDVYAGIVIEQRGDKVNLFKIIGFNDETHPDSVWIDAHRLKLVQSSANREAKETKG